MKIVKEKKNSGRWSKVGHEIATYTYVLDNKDVAAIFPKETRDGKIAWGYFVKRIGSAKEINQTNFTTAPVKLESHYSKKRDAKKAVESVVGVLTCQ
jgi:hypothetical protein